MIHDSNTLIGFIDIRIGYTVLLKACKIIKQVALSYDMKKLYITCNPDNLPSRRTCVKLGLNLIEIVDLSPYNVMYQEGERQKCIFGCILY